MRLKPEESAKLAKKAGDFILSDPQNQFKVPRAKIFEAIESCLRQHFEEERRIEERAEALFKERVSEMEGLQRSKALQMIRQQIATEENFILSGGPEGRFSADKISHLAHLVGDKLYDDDLMDFPDEDDGPKVFKKIFSEYFHQEEEASQRAVKKIQSLSSPPFEGSKEWDTLYRKYFEEEMRRLGH